MYVFRLFSESFEDDLKTIFSSINEKRQNLLFSATITDGIRESSLLQLNKEVNLQNSIS